MANFYTNVQCFGNNILYRGIMDGKRVKQRIDYSPSLYIPFKSNFGTTTFKNLAGEPLQQKIFGDIRSARDYIKQFEDIPGAPLIYGQNRFE